MKMPEQTKAIPKNTTKMKKNPPSRRIKWTVSLFMVLAEREERQSRG